MWVVRAGGAEVDVMFAAAEPGTASGVDAAYHAEYDHYGATIVGHVSGPAAQAVTIRLEPVGAISSGRQKQPGR